MEVMVIVAAKTKEVGGLRHQDRHTHSANPSDPRGLHLRLLCPHSGRTYGGFAVGNIAEFRRRCEVGPGSTNGSACQRWQILHRGLVSGSRQRRLRG